MRRLMGWRTYLGGEDMKRFWKILTTIFVLGLVLVGCGKSSSSSSSSQKQTTVKIGVVGADNRVLQAVAKKGRIVKSSVTFYRRKLQTVSSRLRPYGVDYLNP